MARGVFVFAIGILVVIKGESNGIPNDTEEQGNGVHWALIVAGSNGWYNYRHQADACHAYQIMKKNGIPDERIVVMMFDDIAHNEENPVPGVVINHPNGSDVYHGVPKDYTGKDVTPETFLKVLTGNKEGVENVGSGKVIGSGPQDHVFVNFVDHGAPGILAFPDEELHARDLMSAIDSMHQNKQFKQMVFYVEACESGSMFDELLPKDISVYATTAANSHESSYACYFDKERRTYLGDVYSIKWMEDSDKEDLSLETLHKQFMIVKQETNTSHVMQFGDTSIADESVSEFQAGKKNYQQTDPIVLPSVPLDAVASEDVPLAVLHHRLAAANTEEQEREVLKLLRQLNQERQDIEMSMKHIVGLATASLDQADRVLHARHTLRSFDCYEPVAKLYDRKCFNLSQYDYAMRHLYALVNLCEEKLSIQTISEAIAKVCDGHLY